MKCPSCKNNNTSIIESKPTKSAIKRKRNCTCGIKFITFERTIKIISNSKKTLKRTAWQQQRFILYGEYRVRDAMSTSEKARKFLEENKIKNVKGYQFMKDYKGNTLKGFCAVGWEINGKTYVKRFELPSKVTTIENAVRDSRFWEWRKKIYSKSIKDQLNVKIRKNEEKRLKDSINQYIEFPQFNQDFFIQNSNNKFKKMWKNPEFWGIFKQIS